MLAEELPDGGPVRLRASRRGQCGGELAHLVHDPVGARGHSLAQHRAAVAHKEVRRAGRLGLGVGRAVTDHRDALVAVPCPERRDGLCLAAAAGRELLCVIAGGAAVRAEEQPVCMDVVRRDAELLGERLDDLAEAAGDECDGRAARLQRGDQVRNTCSSNAKHCMQTERANQARDARALGVKRAECRAASLAGARLEQTLPPQ